MPVLLLAQGDPEAKNLLRKAIEARYGINPPVIESLRIDFKGRARAKVGPVTTWVPVDATAQFRFPTAMRWDFTVKPVGVTVQRGIEAFDGDIYRRSRGNSVPTVIDSQEQVDSMQSRLWAVAALLLTPLGDHFVKLTASEGNNFNALNTRFGDAVKVSLRDNNTIEELRVNCLNPDTEQRQDFVMKLSEEQELVNDLMLPKKISTFWDEEPFYEVQPVLVENNPDIFDAVFKLEIVE